MEPTLPAMARLHQRKPAPARRQRPAARSETLSLVHPERTRGTSPAEECCNVGDLAPPSPTGSATLCRDDMTEGVWWRSPMLSVRPLELLHELHERLDGGGLAGVVDGGAEATDGAVPLEREQTLLLGLLDEHRLQTLIRDAVRHVHLRAGVLARRASVEVRRVDGAVEHLGLRVVLLLDAVEPALPLQPAQHLLDHVDRKDGRRVEDLRRVRLVIEHRREAVAAALQELVVD